VIDHVSIQCADLAASAAFYDAVLAPLGGERIMDFGQAMGYGVPPSPEFWISQQDTGDGFRESHLAFTAADRAAVHAFFEAARGVGAEVLHEPQVWPEYHSDYYGAFVRDPDGNNVEAVCHAPVRHGTSTGTGKVVVNRAMSLDGFIAGPDDAQDWIFDFMANDAPWQKEAAAGTGAMLVGRRTVEVGERREARNDRGTESSGEGYPFYGPTFVLTHRPPETPDPDVTYLSGDIGEAVATALNAAAGKDVQVLGADVASQCLQRGLVDEIMVIVMPVLLGDGIRFSAPGLARTDLEPISSTRSGPVTILRFRVRK
jgi:dihydrofolate reductase/catechol 2,3-dioxygenase-like lactoylglutathione lyase family enzyme